MLGGGYSFPNCKLRELAEFSQGKNGRGGMRESWKRYLKLPVAAAIMLAGILGMTSSAVADENATMSDIGLKDGTLETCDVAIGQTYESDMTFNVNYDYTNIGNDYFEFGQAKDKPSNYKVTSDNPTIASVSYDDSAAKWHLTVAPKKVGTATVEAKFEFTSTSGRHYEASKSMTVTAVKDKNPIAKIAFGRWGDGAELEESSTWSENTVFVEKCPICGKSHGGSIYSLLAIKPKDQSRRPTLYTVDLKDTDNYSVDYREHDSYDPEYPSVMITAKSPGEFKMSIKALDTDGSVEAKANIKLSVISQEAKKTLESDEAKAVVGKEVYPANLVRLSSNDGAIVCSQIGHMIDAEKITFEIDNPEVAELTKSRYGSDVLKIKQPGEAYLTEKSVYGTFKVKLTAVNEGDVDINPIKFEKREYTITKAYSADEGYSIYDILCFEHYDENMPGRIGVLSAGAEGALDEYNLGQDGYKYVSSDPSVLQIKQNGSVIRWTGIPRSYGTATVSMYLGDRLCDTMTVHVVPPVETSVSIKSGYKTDMAPGDTQKLTAEVTPEDKASSVVWSSSNENVLKVAQDGTVTAVADGTATITATVDGKTATTDAITVATSVVNVTGVKLSTDKLSLIVNGEASRLTATVEPANATNQNATWSSSDDTVATVDQDGTVTPHAKGTATITVTTEDGAHTATCKVTVIQPATGITLDQEKATIVGAKTLQLKANVEPADADQTLVWKSSDGGVATVDQNGLVTAVTKGNTTVTVATPDGAFFKTCAVTVSNPVSAVTVDRAILDLKKGEKTSVNVTVTGALVGAVDDDNIKIDAENSNGAFKVTEADGVYTVEAIKTGAGSFKLTCGDVESIVTVTVSNPAQKVSLNHASLGFTVGDAASKLTATVSPKDADDVSVTWKSSNESVATVDADGKVTPLKAGTAQITATCAGVSATCSVTVGAKQIAAVSTGSIEVTVSAENGVAASLGDDVSLVVDEPKSLTEQAKTSIEGLKSDKTQVIETLDVHLIKNGEVEQLPEGSSVVVRIKMTDAMKALTNLKVQHVADDGTVEVMETWTEGEYLCFRTSHFSTFVVTGEKLVQQPLTPSEPAQPSKGTSAASNKADGKKSTDGNLANTGDRTFLVVTGVAVAGIALIALATKLLWSKDR